MFSFRKANFTITGRYQDLVDYITAWYTNETTEVREAIDEYREKMDFSIAEAVFRFHRWYTATRNNKLIITDYYGEKYDGGDFLKEIAPFVDDGSYVEMQDDWGDEPEIFRFVFKNGKMKRVYPKIVWPEE